MATHLIRARYDMGTEHWCETTLVFGIRETHAIESCDCTDCLTAAIDFGLAAARRVIELNIQETTGVAKPDDSTR